MGFIKTMFWAVVAGLVLVPVVQAVMFAMKAALGI